MNILFKLILGIGSLLPSFLLSALVVTVVILAIDPNDNIFITGLYWVTLITIPFLLIFYIIDVQNNPSIAKGNRAIWTTLLILGNPVVFPIYWFIYILHRPQLRPG
jgi:hypothetical protein